MFIHLFICVCLYDLAMPICINLDPLNWTHPDLIHIEGDGCRHGAGASAPAASQEAAVSSRSPSPRFAEGPPRPAGVAQEDCPARKGTPGSGEAAGPS